MAVSFRHIEESFKVGKVAKHAFVYMAQSLLLVYLLSVWHAWERTTNLQLLLFSSAGSTHSQSVQSMEFELLALVLMGILVNCQLCKSLFNLYVSHHPWSH